MFYFLDIDGVVVSAKAWKNPELLNDGFPDFSNKAISILQRLLSEEDTIMLTTSHTSKFSIKEWGNIFKTRGLNIKNIQSLPENIKSLTRKDEIINWFNTNIINDDFVIIDDDKSLNDLPAFLKANLVLTSSHIGLTEEHFEVIKSLSHNKKHTT